MSPATVTSVVVAPTRFGHVEASNLKK